MNATRLDQAQRIAADVLAAVARPIVVNGFAYVRWACCEPPAQARAWAVEEAKVAAQMWAAMAARGAIDTGFAVVTERSGEVYNVRAIAR